MSDQVLAATVADLPASKPANPPPRGATSPSQTRLTILAGMVLIGIVYLVVSVLPDRVPYLRSEGAIDASANAIASHCERFIEIARAHYGSNWKYRLDPGDALCASQVQQEWERQWGVPGTPGSDAPAPIKSVSDEIAPPETAPVVEAVPAASKADTSCLNIISLAKTKFGAEWRSNIAPDLQADCAGEISRMAN